MKKKLTRLVWLRGVRRFFSARFLLVFVLVVLLLMPNRLASSRSVKNNSCPTDFNEVASSLLKDLPDYANRVIQTTRYVNRVTDNQTYIMTAGKAEYEPLNLPHLEYDPVFSQSPPQLFFTVLEREYAQAKILERQTYHWLFLTHGDDGWYMVTLYSRFGSVIRDSLPTPPQESSNGIIGQAVNNWLSDCRGGRLAK